MSGNFLLIIPEGWTPLDWDYIVGNVTDMNAGNVEEWIRTSQFENIAVCLKAFNLIPQDAIVLNAKLFDSQYFAVLLAP